MRRPSRHPSTRPRLRAFLIVAAVALAACGGAPRPFESGSAPDPDATPGALPTADGDTRAPIRFTRAVFPDPAADGIEAISVLVPDGWQVEGGVEWLPDWVRAAALHTRVVDPATGTEVWYLPIQDFIWFQAPAGLDAPIGGNYQGKVYLPPITDPAEFVSRFWMPFDLPRLQAARLVGVQQVPAIANEFLGQFGGPADAAAYRLRYEYDQDGQTWEEDVSFALLFSGSAELTSWYVNYAITVRAPKGQLDASAGVISTVIASRTTTPQWEATYRLVQQLFNQGIQQQMADTVAFGETLARHRAESAALQEQVTQERLASQDRIAELRRETLGGVETYVDPVNGGLVQLPVGWNDYWVNPQGGYLTSDQPGFDPNTLNQGFWQRLERRAP